MVIGGEPFISRIGDSKKKLFIDFNIVNENNFFHDINRAAMNLGYNNKNYLKLIFMNK